MFRHRLPRGYTGSRAISPVWSLRVFSELVQIFELYRVFVLINVYYLNNVFVFVFVISRTVCCDYDNILALKTVKAKYEGRELLLCADSQCEKLYHFRKEGKASKPSNRCDCWGLNKKRHVQSVIPYVCDGHPKMAYITIGNKCVTVG